MNCQPDIGSITFVLVGIVTLVKSYNDAVRSDIVQINIIQYLRLYEEKVHTYKSQIRYLYRLIPLLE